VYNIGAASDLASTDQKAKALEEFDIILSRDAIHAVPDLSRFNHCVTELDQFVI
jgi:hypothetical protein